MSHIPPKQASIYIRQSESINSPWRSINVVCLSSGADGFLRIDCVRDEPLRWAVSHAARSGKTVDMRVILPRREFTKTFEVVGHVFRGRMAPPAGQMRFDFAEKGKEMLQVFYCKPLSK